ncbi:MAG: hypothetical protein HPY75_03275 [Actinobacteria bacterium]|nr:hypothetical protein [Actinomycetota bacterium]
MRTRRGIGGHRIVGLALAGLLVLGAALGVGMGPAGLAGLARPGVAHAAPPQPAWMPRALIIDCLGAAGAQYGVDDDAAAAKLSELGFIVDRYEDTAAPDYTEPIPWTHWTLAEMFRLNTYNLVVYYGHGNEYWGMVVGNAGTYMDHYDDYRYPIDAYNVCEGRKIWGDPTRNYAPWRDRNGTEYPVKLDEDAMVLLVGACYSAGMSSIDPDTPILSDAEILRRINEYSYTFLHQERPGAGTYVAKPFSSAASFLDTLAHNPNTPIGQLAVPDYSSSGATLLEGPHPYMGGAGMRYRKNKRPGTTNGAIWRSAAWAGDPEATFRTVLHGYVPGDKNGDGDNTDPGEPYFDPYAWYSGPIPQPPEGYDTAWYFAEGYTGYGFQEYLTLGNPGEAEARAQVLYLSKDGTWKLEELTIPGSSRATVNVNASAGPDREVSARVCSDSPIVAERPMYFAYNGAWTGGHDTMGARAPDDTWYFAEGYTGAGFEQYVCVLNPGATVANLTFRFQTEEAGEVVKAGLSVPAQSRATFRVNDVLGTGYQNSLKLLSDQPVVVERPMYFDYAGRGDWHWTGGHCVMGLNELATEYCFAEGTTRGGFEEWLTLQNPGGEAITVKATYQLGPGQGEPVEKSYEVGAGKRRTVFVPEEVGTEKDVSVKLSCADLFLAERPMYFRYTGYGADWTGGHCVIGTGSAGGEWLFAEGYTGEGFHEWLCLQNPGDEDAVVEITYLTQEAGQLPARTEAVPAGTRVTLWVNDHAGAGYQLSARLRVLSGPGIVAERPMYFSWNGWDGGHDVVGYAP